MHRSTPHTGHHPHPPPHHHADGDRAQPQRRSWLPLGVVAVAQFMVILDVTVVNVALPSIDRSLRFGSGQLQWVVTAYLLFTGGLMLLGGRLADMLGRRPVFLAGLGLFTAASLVSGLAWSPGSLIVARAAQGVGAALLLPSALSIITTTYDGGQRAKALAVWGALGSAGAAAGVLFGGILTDTLGWEWVFLINVPVGLGLAVTARRAIARSATRRTRLRELDLRGAGLLMVGLVSLVLAIEGTSTHGWTSLYSVGLAALSAGLLTAFGCLERASAAPLIPPATWRVRSLVSSAAIMFTATGILVGAFFLNTLYLQRVMDASPLETGLAFLPLTLIILMGAHAASHVLPRVGSRAVVVAGLAVTAGGAALLSGAPADPGYVADLLPGYLVLGFGLGLTFVAVSVAAMADVAHAHAGLASGLMTTAHELGAALGVAVLASVAAAGSTIGDAAGVVDGFGDGLLVAGGAAVIAALLAAVSVPSVRPEPGMAHGMH